MQIALEASVNGIFAQVKKQSLIATNLANLTTTAFKKVNLTQAAFRFPGTRVVHTPLTFTQGDIVSTGQELDVAIAGDGFLRVLKGGIPAYTRAGNLHKDADGNLVTPHGYPVDPGITFPDETERVEISKNGDVFAIVGGGARAVNVGRLEVVRFINNQGLISIGENLFLEGPDSGTPINGDFLDDGFPALSHRALEESNVNLTEEVTDEVLTHRALQANMRSFRVIDEIIGETLELFL